MSKASSSRAFRSGGRPGRMSPARGSSSSRAGSAARGVEAARAASWASSCSRSACRSANRARIRPRSAGGGGVGRVGGELFEFEDAGVLGGVDLLEPGLDGGGGGVAVGGRGGVGGGELGGEQLGAAGAEHVVGEEQPDDLVQAGFGGLDGAGVVRGGGGVPGVGGVVRALVVHPGPGGRGVGAGAHPAAAVPAPDPAPVGVGPGRGRVPAQPRRRPGWSNAPR